MKATTMYWILGGLAALILLVIIYKQMTKPTTTSMVVVPDKPLVSSNTSTGETISSGRFQVNKSGSRIQVN